jgi:hypothetical protein
MEDGRQGRTVDDRLATRAIVGAQGLRQRNETRVAITIDVPGLGDQPNFGGARVTAWQQRRGGGRQVVLTERKPPGMPDGFGTLSLGQVLRPALEIEVREHALEHLLLDRRTLVEAAERLRGIGWKALPAVVVVAPAVLLPGQGMAGSSASRMRRITLQATSAGAG